MEIKSIKVRIYDKEYQLKGEDEELIKQSAAHVDSLMTQFHEKNPQQTPSIIAVLAALNIAEEMILMKRKNESTMEEIEEHTKSLSNKIRTYLDIS